MTTERENTAEQEPGTALVLRRLSLVPTGADRSALAVIDEFAFAAPAFTDHSEMLIANAETFEVNDQAACQMADDIQDGLKAEIKEWDERRLSVTRPIADLKDYITNLIKPGIENRRRAIAIYQQKIGERRRKIREAEQAAQREAERVLAEERRKIEDEARKREEAAQNLKTAAARQRAADDAQRLREQAEMIPESVALATSGPTLSSSTAAEVWEGSVPLCDFCADADKKRPDPKRECPHNKKLALETILAKWDEWHGVIAFKPAGLNDMARRYRETIQLPGLQFERRESFRSSSKRTR